jgi:hypothetical protein
MKGSLNKRLKNLRDKAKLVSKGRVFLKECRASAKVLYHEHA